MNKQKLRQKSCILPFKEEEITATQSCNIIKKENVRPLMTFLKENRMPQSQTLEQKNFLN